jgi:hypothetical protein
MVGVTNAAALPPKSAADVEVVAGNEPAPRSAGLVEAAAGLEFGDINGRGCRWLVEAAAGTEGCGPSDLGSTGGAYVRMMA